MKKEGEWAYDPNLDFGRHYIRNFDRQEKINS